VLAIEASLEHEGSGYAVTRARIAIEGQGVGKGDGKAICDAELRFRIMPFPADLSEQMRAQARRIGLLETA
jgi:3-hydroxyacyl-[acyl-carrier-protein] dehydratase